MLCNRVWNFQLYILETWKHFIFEIKGKKPRDLMVKRLYKGECFLRHTKINFNVKCTMSVVLWL